VKEQYVGDVNDYRKYALLRQLADGGKTRIGVCWMLTPADDRRDGGKTGYLQPEKASRWRHHDPELYDALKEVTTYVGVRRLRQIEQSGVIPGASYFNEFLSDRADLRQAFFIAAMTELAKAPLIFFDPDNGIDVPSTPKGRTNSSKYIYRDEIAETYGAGHSVLIYQHYPRERREGFIERLDGDLARLAVDAGRWCFRTQETAFFLLVHPKHTTTLGGAAIAAVGKWQADFPAVPKL
jgi:hypothetical protein